MPLRPSQLVSILTRSLVGLLALAAAVGLYVLLVATKPEVEAADPDRFTMRLAVYPLRQVEVERQWLGYGTAQAKLAAEVPARVTAVVTERPAGIEPGNPVDEGQVLVRLDASDFEQQLESARQNLAELRTQLKDLTLEEDRLEQQLEIDQRDLDIARREFERIERVFERGAANRQDVDARESQLLAAKRAVVLSKDALSRVPVRREALEARVAAQEAAIATARLALERTTVTSPIAGELQRIDVEVGESVAPGQAVARVVDPSVIEVPVKLPASAAGRVAVGDPIVLREVADESRSWSSEVVRVAPEQDPAQRTLTVYAEVTQDPDRQVGRLAPGAFLEGVVSTAEPEPRWAVPRRSVRRGRVYLVRDQTVQSLEVETLFEVEQRVPASGLEDDLWVVLANDDGALSRGARVVLNASPRLADGQRAEVELAGAPLNPTAEASP